MRYAIKAALLSGAEHHRVGAAIFKGKSLVSLGWNSTKTHPDSKTRYNAHHAEFDCLMGNYKHDLVGASIFVARITKGGRLGVSKPCSECEVIIRGVGIKKIYYINQNGEVERMKRA
jgi:deoxycytidylate deaminase